MTRAAFVRNLFPLSRLKDTVQRFPLSSLCAVAAFVLTLLMMHEHLKDEDMFSRIFSLLACGYFWFGIAKLLAESRNLKPFMHFMLALGPYILLGIFIFLSPFFCEGRDTDA